MPAEKYEGIHYKRGPKMTKTGSLARRKPTMDELYRVREACERSQRASDAIRAAAGLDPVAPNFYRRALADEIARREATARKPKRRRREVPAALANLAARHGFRVVPA